MLVIIIFMNHLQSRPPLNSLGSWYAKESSRRVKNPSNVIAPGVAELGLTIPRIGHARQTMQIVVAVVGRQRRERAATIRIGLGDAG
jgi:hypothetical protein